MKTVIGVIIGIALVLAFQKIINDKKPTESTDNNTNTSSVENPIPQDFIDFYSKFHADSLFQIDHISFPLEGLPYSADSLTVINNNFRWQKEDWKMHRPFDEMDGTYEKKLIPLSDKIVFENIRIVNSNFAMQRRFSKNSSGWKLIYYAAPNEVE